MAKGRKKKTTTETAVEPLDTAAENTATAVMDKPSSTSARAAEPPFEPTGTYVPEANEPEAGKPTGRGRYRSFTTDPSRGYTKLVDKEKERLVLLFDQKPADDVRTAMKGAGFQYHPDYDGHKNAWTRRNDYEGRLQVEALETLIRATSSGVESPSR